MAGVILGVGLFCGVLFFVDGLSASMTQRAVAPLAIDMQRIVTARVGNGVVLTQRIDGAGELSAGRRTTVHLDVRNGGEFPAHEVAVRSTPGPGLGFVENSASVDGTRVEGYEDNPFSHGLGRIGLNLRTLEPGATHRLAFSLAATRDTAVDTRSVRSSFSTREAVLPTAANQPASVELAELARQMRRVDGVAHAAQLSIADLGANTLSSGERVASGATKIFGFDASYAERDRTIGIVDGRLGAGGAALSVEAARALRVSIGDHVSVHLPDGSTIEPRISAIVDLSQARSLFSSRRGGDLETFVYSRNGVVVSPSVFANHVFPAYERAATEQADRLKAPPIREVDVTLQRALLDADPATATDETKGIAHEITAVAAHQDYLLDNISNTLTVAAEDATAAKRLFAFLGVPGALLAAVLAGYAGNVLAEAQRREQATLRVRGASRSHLRRMLALRTALLTGAGALVGLVAGYVTAAVILGEDALSRASNASLAFSALLGTLGGFIATGVALYVTGRRSIDREINEDRARLTAQTPVWRRAGLDVALLVVLAVGTAIALNNHAFDGKAGSVYFGRAVELNLALLVLPIAVWVAGSLLAARVLGTILSRSRPLPGSALGPPISSLFRRSVGRRPWPIGNGAIVVTLIVALSACLAAFTASYDSAKVKDARFANGSDIRITPSPRAENKYPVSSANRFKTNGVAEVTPVIYGLSNVVLRSERTSDPANLAAVDPARFAAVVPVQDRNFVDRDAASALATIRDHPNTVLLGTEIASFLKLAPGDTVYALLARGTDQQVDVPLRVAGLFDRLPAFPDGADALMSLGKHTERVPSKTPDFFLARTDDTSGATLRGAVASLSSGPGTAGDLRFDTRATVLSRDQSSLAALNIAGLIDLDSGFALTMAAVVIAIFVFGLLLARRREYVTLRAQGLEPRSVRRLITAEAGTVAIAGAVAGSVVGLAMGYYFVRVLRPLFVLPPEYEVSLGNFVVPVAVVVVATLVASIIAAWMVQRLEPTELLRDD